MDVVVRKYGGSSLASTDLLGRASEQLIGLQMEGHAVVAVVSAMGEVTDRLLTQAAELAPAPGPRELDLLLASGEAVSAAMLALAVQARGVEAVALTGRQAGIHTDGQHLESTITRIDTSRIERELEAGRVVIVAGFQGLSKDGEVTTLGRGGSDLTAVALAAALRASRCELLSDVAGVHTADPLIVAEARPLAQISWAAMTAMARSGARVLQTRSVEHAAEHGVTVFAASADDPSLGTVVSAESGPGERPGQVLAVTGRPGLIRLRFDAERGESLQRALPPHQVILDGPAAVRGSRELVLAPEPGLAQITLAGALQGARLDGVELEVDVGLVAVIGPFGSGTRSAVEEVEAVLETRGIRTHQAFTRPWTVAALVDADQVDEGIRALHATFLELEGRTPSLD